MVIVIVIVIFIDIFIISATNRDFSNKDFRILGLVVLFFRTFCSKSDFFRPIFGSKSDFYA